jgi:quercetin dioxygenase-like cupin family protein
MTDTKEARPSCRSFGGDEGDAQMDIKRNGSQASAKGPAQYFTGTVRVDAPFKTTAPARVSGATVTFEPGARTAWHTHPFGQTLIVTFGCGRVQCEGGSIEEIRAGNVVWSGAPRSTGTAPRRTLP